MEDVITEIIRQTKETRKSEHKEPTAALFYQDIVPGVIKAARETINKMVANKSLKWEKTINDDSFKLINDEE